jgi:N-acetylglutamate synthase-like GNAT family acetyltransferase
MKVLETGSPKKEYKTNSGLVLNETKNIDEILNMAKLLDIESAGLESTKIAWIALQSNVKKGIGGVICVDAATCILLPIAAKEEEIQELLIKKALNWARQNKYVHAYTMTNYVKAHEKVGFKQIEVEEFPEAV